MKVLELKGNCCRDVAAETAEVISKGGVAIVPTDTLYGLVCDGLNSPAKEKIFRIKGRSCEKPLIGFVDTVEKVEKFAHIPPNVMPVLLKSWPGAATFIFKGKSSLPGMTSGRGAIAFRIPRHDLISGITRNFEIIASTSANFSGMKNASSVKDMPEELKKMSDIIVCGGRTDGKPSSIWDATEENLKLLRGTVLFVCEGNTCRSPMAEFMLRDFLKNSNLQVKTESAGIGISGYGCASPNTCEAMEETGMNLKGFISRSLTDTMVKNSDLIFVMEESQRGRILFRDPGAEDKITVLNVKDPAGGNLKAYRETRDILRDIIKKTVLTRICLN